MENTAATLISNDGGGLVAAADTKEAPLEVYQFTDVGENPTTRRALLLPDTPGHQERHILRTTMDGEEIDFHYYTNNHSDWGCQGHEYGCKKCDAFAARKFKLLPTEEELELNPDAKPKVVPFCATCGYWLMGGKVPDGDKDGKAPVGEPVQPGAREIIRTEKKGSNVITEWMCRGGNREILDEGAYDGGLNKINFAYKLGDTPQISQGLKEADQNGVYNTASHGVGRESPHLTSAPYEDGGPPPGQPGYESNWLETREKLGTAHPPFEEVFKEIEECNGCEIFDGHITYSLLEKMEGSTAAKTIIGYFHEHGDKPFHGKTEKRGILSSGRPVGKERKIMRINDRKYGRWVDIEIDHGTFIEMDHLYSGSSSGRYTHSIRDADGTYAIVLDYGKREIV